MKFGKQRADASRRRSHRPAVEGLEGRQLMYAATGGVFSLPARITYSFAPDGTSIGGTASTLDQALAKRGIATATWQEAIKKAASAWQAVAKVEIAQVADDGSPFGTSGNQQGDPRFGDIRIGGTTQAQSVLARAFLPPPYNGGALAGDIVFNTAQAWQVNNDYDLQTVAVHEFGHALGLDHSAVASASLYATYLGTRQALTADDTSGIRSLYGQRAADGADTSSTAATITGSLDAAGRATIAGKDIASSTDNDWYYVTAPASSVGTLQVTVQSKDLSSLSPKLLVYSQSMTGLAIVAAANSYGATVAATVAGATSGKGFYIRVQAANGGSSGVGAYALQVNFSSSTMAPVAPPNTAVPQKADLGGGSASQKDIFAGLPSAIVDLIRAEASKASRDVVGTNDHAESELDKILAWQQSGTQKEVATLAEELAKTNDPTKRAELRAAYAEKVAKVDSDTAEKVDKILADRDEKIAQINRDCDQKIATLLPINWLGREVVPDLIAFGTLAGYGDTLTIEEYEHEADEHGHHAEPASPRPGPSAPHGGPIAPPASTGAEEFGGGPAGHRDRRGRAGARPRFASTHTLDLAIATWRR